MATTVSPSPNADPGRDARFNFLAFLCDMVSYFGAAALLSPVTILPLYASRLTDSPEMIAWIPTLAQLGVTLPQILGARFVAGRTLYRPFFVRLVIVERTAVFLCVLSMAWLARAPAMQLLWVPMGFLFLWWGFMGVNSPAYAAMLGHAIPPERRGRLFGLGAALGGGVGFLFAWMARYLLEALPFPLGFVACAGIAFLTLTAGILPLCFVREAPGPSPHERDLSMERPVAILRRDSPFRMFLFSQVLFALQAMPTAIWTSYALRRFHADAADVASITAVLAIAGGATFLVVGWLADHVGNRAVLLGATALTAVAAAAAWAAPTLPLYIATFVPAAVASSGWQLASFNILMEFAPPGRVPAYSATSALVAGPFRVVAPLVGGALVAQMGRHGPVFLIAAVAALASCLTLAFVHEPRWNASPGERYDGDGM